MTRPILVAASICAATAFASCSSAQTEDNSAPATQSAAPSSIVEGEPLALSGQSAFSATIHGALNEPWAIAVHPGDGRLFITEKGGTAAFYDPATGRMGSVTGLPQVAYGGQGGLGDFVFGPDFSETGTVYVSWAASGGGDAGDGARKAVVGRGTLVCEEELACSIEDLQQIWEQSEAIASNGHFSHRIVFSPDGEYLFVTSGDRMQQDPAQDLSNNLGTIVRLLPDGTPAPGNPFADRGSPTDQIWTYGQRNMLGIAFDPVGELWALEHGPAGGDELNKVERGNNYGWPLRSNGENYDGTPIPDHTPDDGFTRPVIYWTPVIAPGDFIFYTGAMWPEWNGQVLIFNLRTTSISRVSIAEDDASAKEVSRYEFPERLRDIAQGPDGSIWVIEDGEEARLLRLVPASGQS